MKAGIRRVRQDLSALLREVRAGREIEITDRGEPVARLAPPRTRAAKPCVGRAALRASLPRLAPPLSRTLARGREDRF